VRKSIQNFGETKNNATFALAFGSTRLKNAHISLDRQSAPDAPCKSHGLWIVNYKSKASRVAVEHQESAAEDVAVQAREARHRKSVNAE
jgi:hypothetical protein